MDYCELHNHSFFSLLDGFNSPLELATVAHDLGHTAISLTDHGTLSGHRELQQACATVGIKPILGMEAYISPTDRFQRVSKKKSEDNTQVYNHIILQAKSQQGLENLQAMSENAWDEGFYYKPRIDKELLDEYGDGIIVLSGCMNGLISKAIERDEYEAARGWMEFFTERFGEDFYVEVQPHNPPELNAALYKYAQSFGVKTVVTNDCHFSKREERAAEDLMLILSTKPKASKLKYSDVKHLEIFDMLDALYPDRTMSFADLDLYLKSAADVHAEIADEPWAREAIDSTQEIAAKVGDYEYYEGLDLLPSISVDVPDEVALRGLCENWLRDNDLLDNDEYRDRMDEELKTIADLNFSRYFLIVADVIKYARSQDVLVGPGRGSAAGSLVVYALGITDVNPIEHGLLFFRFLDPDRGDWPDIDMDFPDDRRAEIIDYVREKYGYVANISTYGFFTDKGVIKSAARALGVPYAEVERMAKTISTFEEYVEQQDRADTSVGKFHAKYPLVIDYATQLRGKINQVGVHAAGIVVSKEPIEKYAPVEYRTKEDTKERVPAIVYDMGAAESVGLIKFDFLGLKTLSVIQQAAKLAGVELPRSYNDKHVLREYADGNTVGIFQAEQSAYTKLLSQMSDVEFTFKDLVASNALVRPGAMNTVGKEYLARRAGRAPVEYDHPLMREITSETFGVLIYQEQLMLAAVALGGFSMQEANKLRRIIGKKKDAAEFKPFEEKWMDAASKLVGVERAAKLWGDFQAHAGYSFNKSHAVAYSMISYWTMWLKHYHPLEFLAASLGAEKSASKNAKWTKLMLESKRLGVKVLLPHVNLSDDTPTIHDGAVLLGLTNIKFISDGVAEPLRAARPFESYEHLVETAGKKKSGISKRVISALNALNAASFPDNKPVDVRPNLYEYIGIPSFPTEFVAHPERISSLEDFEESGAFVFQGLVHSIKRGKGWSQVTLLDETAMQTVFHDEDTQLLEGTFYTLLVASNRVVDWITDEPSLFSRWMAADHIPGDLVLCVEERTTKAGKLMATGVFSTPQFELSSALIFPHIYARLKSRLRAGILATPFVGEMDDGGFMLKGLN